MPSYKVGMKLDEARKLAEQLTTRLKELGAKRVETTGSVLREQSDIGDIDLIVDGEISKMAKEIGEVKGDGADRITLIYEGQQVNLFRGSEDNWGAMQMYLTGPKGYVIGYRMRAKKMGYVLNQHGLFDDKDNLVAGQTEEGIYKALGKEWKPPKARGKR